MSATTREETRVQTIGIKSSDDARIRLLAADSDPSVREILRFCANEEKWHCDEARDGISALKLLRRWVYSLVLLEAELPEIKGEIVCAQIRKNSRVPVIFLGRKDGEDERLNGFYAGGNDFVPKPFYPRELMARIKNLLDLSGATSDTRKIVTSGPMTIDTFSHSVTVDRKEVQLTPREYDLFLFLCQNPGKAFSRDALLDLVWGKHFFGTDRTVDTHVKSLRNKIKPHDGSIVTIWGFGYKFEI